MIRYKDEYSKKSLNEASLGRIFSHITNNTCFGMITAFRGEYNLKKNRERNEDLEQEIRRLRFGFNKVKGYFVENNGKDPVVEESYIVYSTPGRQKELKDFLKSTCKEYNQDAVLIVSGGKASFWYSNGKEEGLGPFYPNPRKLGQAYSVLKGKPFRFGDPYYADQEDDDNALNECVLECVPIKAKSDNMANFVGYCLARKRIQKYGEHYFESLNEETRQIQEYQNRFFEEDSKRQKCYPY